MKALACLLLLCLPTAAAGLSCAPWGVTDAYRAAAKSDAPYVVVRGTLRFDAARLPRGDHTGQTRTPPRTVIPAEIEGVALGPSNLRVAKAYKLRLVVQCAGPWCARPKAGDTLAFIRRDGASYVLEATACGAFLFSKPSAEETRAVQTCLNSGPCPPWKDR